MPPGDTKEPTTSFASIIRKGIMILGCTALAAAGIFYLYNTHLKEEQSVQETTATIRNSPQPQTTTRPASSPSRPPVRNIPRNTTDQQQRNITRITSTEKTSPQWVENYSSHPQVKTVPWFLAEDCPDLYRPATDSFALHPDQNIHTTKGYYSSGGYICLAYSEAHAFEHPTDLALHELAHAIEFAHYNNTNHGIRFVRLLKGMHICQWPTVHGISEKEFKDEYPEINCKSFQTGYSPFRN